LRADYDARPLLTRCMYDHQNSTQGIHSQRHETRLALGVRILGYCQSMANCNSALVGGGLHRHEKWTASGHGLRHRERFILVAHLVVTIINVATPGGARSVVAFS